MPTICFISSEGKEVYVKNGKTAALFSQVVSEAMKSWNTLYEAEEINLFETIYKSQSNNNNWNQSSSKNDDATNAEQQRREKKELSESEEQTEMTEDIISEYEEKENNCLEEESHINLWQHTEMEKRNESEQEHLSNNEDNIIESILNKREQEHEEEETNMIKPNYLIVRRNKRKKKRQNYLYAEKTYGDKVESLLEQEEEEEEQYRERSFEETEEYEEEEEYKEEYMHDREEEALPTQQQSSVNGKKEKEEISKSKQRNKKRKVHQRANYTNRLYVTCSSIETNNIMENNYKTNTLNKEEHEKERSLENNDDEGTCDNKSNGYENETIYSEPENINNNDEEQRKHLLCNEMELKSSELIAVNDNSNNSISARELNERNDSCVNESKTTSLNTLSHNVNNINKRNELTLTKYEQEEEYEQEEGGEEEKAHTSSVNNTVCLLRKKFNHDNNKELEYLEEEEECEQVTEEKETSQSHLLNNTLLHDCKGVIDTNSSISNYNYKAYYSDEDVEFIKNVLKAPEPLSELPMKLQRISKSCIEEKLKERRRSLHSVTTSSTSTKTSNAESNASIRNNNNNNNSNSNIKNNSEYSHKLELDTTTINGNIDAKCELKSTDRINVEITTANAAELNSSLELLPRESEQQYYSSCASSLTNLSSSHKTTSLSSLTSPLSALSTASSYSPSNRRVSLTSVKNAPTIIKKLDENAINTFYDDFDDNDNNYDNNNDNEEQEEQEEDEIEEKEDDDQEVNAEDDDVTWNVAQLHVQARKGNRRGSSNNENSNNKNKSNNNNKSSQVDFNEYNGEHTQNHNNSDNANTLVYRCHVDPFASYECERGVEEMYNSHGTHRFSKDEHFAEIITNNDSINNNNSINNNVCNSSNGETLHNEETECHSSTLGLTSNTGNTNLSTFSTNNSNTTNTNVKDQYELLSPPCTLQYSNCFTLPHIGESNLFHNENIIYNAQSSVAPHLPLTGLNINTDFNKISVSNDDSDNHNNDNNNNNNTCEFANWQHSQSELDNEEYLNWQSPRSFHQRTPCMIEMEDSPNTVRLLSSDGTEMILHTSYRDNSNKDECDVNSINNINNNNYSNSSNNNNNNNNNNIVELETCTEVNSVDLPSGNGTSNTCMFNEQDNANILHPEEIQKEETNECLSDKEKMKQDCLEEKQIKDTITEMEFCNRRMSKELIVFDFHVNKMEECNTEVEHRDNNAVLASEQTTVTLRDKEICESETTVLQSHNKCCLPFSTHVLNLCAEFLNRLEDRRCTLESEEALRKWEETEMHDNKLNRDVDMEDEISNDSFVNTVKITLDSHNINNNINNNNNNKCINDDAADFTSSTSLLMTSVQHAQDSMTHQLLTHIPASPLTQPLISLLPEWEIEYLYKDVLEYAEQEIAQLRVLSAICPEFDFSCPAMSLRMMKTQMSKMKDDEKNDINENDNNNSNSSSGSSSGNDKIDNAKANTMLENNDFTNEDNNNNNNDNSREGDVINSFSNNISSAETISEKNNGVKSDSKGAKKLRSILQTPIPPKSGMKTIIELMKLAKVLQIVELSNLCAACMADYMLRCAFLEEDCFTAAQSIRSAFNIENDFTNKERDCLVIENEWPANEN